MSDETTTVPQSIDPEFREQATEALKNVSDPELGVNIVDLGLIYDLAYDEEHDALVAAFRINWVWMPPWTPERITDDGRDMMRALGFAI
jgi:metal-sulfur cluster biosynthetic enzyme